MKRMSIVVVSVCVFVLAVSISAHCMYNASAEEAAVGAAQAQNVGNKICPVTGDKIDADNSVTYEYDGKIYNFCCPMCKDPFKADPKKYIAKVEEELKSK